jgi:hypothetical protein
MSNPQFNNYYLTAAEAKLLNDIYARAHKKYTTGSSIKVATAEPLSHGEAVELANLELANVRAQTIARFDTRENAINENYQRSVDKANSEGQKRGLANSTIVLHQLARALNAKQQRIEKLTTDRTLALAKFDMGGEHMNRITKRIMRENANLARVIHDVEKFQFNNVVNNNLISPTLAQKHIDDEVYAEYLHFLLQFQGPDALAYVNTDPLFFNNLSPTYYARLKTAIQAR